MGRRRRRPACPSGRSDRRLARCHGSMILQDDAIRPVPCLYRSIWHRATTYLTACYGKVIDMPPIVPMIWHTVVSKRATRVARDQHHDRRHP
jgi:hypothetical protein